mgnify:CR=1 FL=1
MDVWRQSVRSDLAVPLLETTASTYELPKIAKAPASDDTWEPTAAALTPRENHTAVWTGSEMIVWGGHNSVSHNTGARYNPGTDTWTAMTVTGAASARNERTVSTNSEWAPLKE